MKSIRNGRTGWIALFIAMVASLSIVEPGRASPPRFERFRVSTKDFALNFEVGDDGRLFEDAGADDGADDQGRRHDGAEDANEAGGRSRFHGSQCKGEDATGKQAGRTKATTADAFGKSWG